MSKPDPAHRWTDEQLTELEKRIAAEYKKAADELTNTINAYFENFKKRDAETKALIGTVVNGKVYTKEDYKQWRLAQIGRGKRFQDLRDKLAERYTKANEVTTAYTNDTAPGIYSLNRNYAAYTIEQESGNVGFTLWDEQTVKRLIVEEPDLMPYYPPERAVKRGFDLEYGKKQITKSVTSSILQGKSIKHMADDLQSRIETMNRTSAIRAARTAVTGAQNAGRMDSYAAAMDMGITLKRQWMATLDNRTRHAHRELDGQKAEMGKPFKVDGHEIMYPGDPSAPGYLVYNCRCTLIADVEGVDTSDRKRRAVDPETGESVVISDMTYTQWETWKKSKNATAWEAYQKKGQNRSADQKQFKEYKKILWKKIPDRFDEFQNLKYNQSEKWEALKTLKKQTETVKNAPCVTTPKKFTGYFLKQGAKHADQFFEVGYSQDDPMRLRYDIAKQFDMDKAVDIKELGGGAKKFNIYMELGVTKKKRFLTGWIQDAPDSKPRIVTGFRKDRGQNHD